MFGQCYTGKCVGRARNGGFLVMSFYTWPVFLARGWLDHSRNEQDSPKEGNDEAPGRELRPGDVSTWRRSWPDIRLNFAAVSGLCAFLSFQEDVLRLFTVTECATGNRPAGRVRGKTNGFTETQNQLFPDWQAALEVSVASAQNTGPSQGVDF